VHAPHSAWHEHILLQLALDRAVLLVMQAPCCLHPTQPAAMMLPDSDPACCGAACSRGIIHRDIKPGNIMTSQPLLTPLLSATAYMQATTIGSGAAPAPPQQGTPSSPHPAPPTPHAPAHRGQPQPATGKVKAMSSAQLASCSWKLIDFGIATRASSNSSLQGLQHSLLALPGLCQLASALGLSNHSQAALSYDTPAYAPPEAILELPVTPAYDMWSLGCVVYEMATGSKLFTPAPHSKYSAPAVHLYQMACLLGSPPRKLLTRSNIASEYLDHKGALHMEVDHGLHMASVADMLVAVGGLPAGKARDLADFIEPLLEYDPEQRASAAQMLKHAWLAAE
jgi:serine/threonine protein kinase